MKNTALNLEIIYLRLVSKDLNTNFKFAPHHTTRGVNIYEALLNFEANNWETLGETQYIVYLEGAEAVVFEGNNATARFAAYMEDFTPCKVNYIG